MKVEKLETIKAPIDIAIAGARLLTKEEAEALPKRLRLYQYWWWTSSAISDIADRAFYVNGSSGNVFSGFVFDATEARPVLIFESSSLQIGDLISVAGLEFEMITDNLAFCLRDIGSCAFREDWQAKDANQYDTSDIKKFVDKWFEENVK